MGLDTSHECWHGSYSAFTRWRHMLANAAGYAVWSVKYEGGIHMDTIMIDWGHITEDNLRGEWSEPQRDPLIYLLAHSDCEGVIKPEQAAPLARRLREMIPLLPDENNGGHIGNCRDKTMAFIRGLELAAERGENVGFY